MAGRPPKYTDRLIPKMVCIPADLMAKVQAIADRTRMSFNEVVISALSKEIDNEAYLETYSREREQLRARIAKLENELNSKKTISEPKPKLVPCVVCGKQTQSDLCSDFCREQHRKKIKNKTCRTCGKSSGSSSFCSDVCYARYRKQRNQENQPALELHVDDGEPNHLVGLVGPESLRRAGSPSLVGDARAHPSTTEANAHEVPT